MIVKGTTEDGKEYNYRPEDIIEDIVGEVDAGEITPAEGVTKLWFAFGGGFGRRWFFELIEDLPLEIGYQELVTLLQNLPGGHEADAEDAHMRAMWGEPP